MFPSQRGNFFPHLLPHAHLPRARGKQGSRSTRQKSPPLGVSAVSGSNARTTQTIRTLSRTIIRSPIPSNTVVSPLGTFSNYKSRHVTSTLTKISRQRNSSDSPFATKVDDKSNVYPPQLPVKNIPSANTSQILMSRIPSTWSNQWSANDSFFEYNLRHGFNMESSSSNSNIFCENKGNCTGKLQPKIEQERLLIKKLIEEAMKNRKEALALYSKFYNDDVAETDGFMKAFHPEDHKGRLCDFMLKLVTARDKMLEKRRGPYCKAATCPLSDGSETTEPRYTPVYCVGGKTLLGKPQDSISFPNSFAPLTELMDPSDDPPGYRRFCTLVNMKGFKDKEIFLRATKKCLTVDGVRLKKDASKNQSSSARVLSIYVELPKGVYPEHLKIGRSVNGILVIQEPWKF